VDSCDNSLSALFANIYRKNYQYDEIRSFVEAQDPDLLLFVEFADHHYENLSGFLEEHYPYINRAVWSKDLMVGSMVFSKYPFRDLAGTIDQDAWRYGYFALDIDGQEHYFYLVHTSSPVSKSFWEMRNAQLDKFVIDYHQHGFDRDGAPVMLVGDFNISPWV